MCFILLNMWSKLEKNVYSFLGDKEHIFIYSKALASHSLFIQYIFVSFRIIDLSRGDRDIWKSPTTILLLLIF